MNHISSGIGLEEARNAVGIGWTTIYRWRKQHSKLDLLITATKSARYSAAGKRRMEK